METMASGDVLKAPFPWFGGKSRAAGVIWDRLGDVKNYVEPFAGSLAVLLARPHEASTETVNDFDCYLANFWRAVAAAPDEVAAVADHPVNEADLHARHTALMAAKAAHRERMLTEPDYFDVKLAGWWVWGQCAWIGSGWTMERGACRKLPHVGDAGQGVHHRKLPHVGNAGLHEWFARLSNRLRRVRVACGDWRRVLGPSVTFRHGLTGVLLDPPYAEGNMEYSEHSACSAEVREWCLENGENPLLRIALCGLEGEHELPGWECVAWTTRGGYGSQRRTGDNDNRKRERIWFSPACLKPFDAREALLFP